MNTPQRPVLDGHRCTGEVPERGKAATDADTLIFDSGRFRSAAGEKWVLAGEVPR